MVSPAFSASWRQSAVLDEVGPELQPASIKVTWQRAMSAFIDDSLSANNPFDI
jgi:hypothetical protein